jgi:predicted  nucleic acid-binding Zn-ribbon protein
MSDDEQRLPLDEAGETTLPIVEVLTGRGFITGKSGSGKSNSASVLVEQLLDRGFPVLIVDTDGEYWGLKESYEILHVGADEECDLHVGPEHAEKLAELALDQDVPIILDVSGYLDESDASALVRETASALFANEKKLNKPFLLLVEEIHEYLPEGAGSDETAQMLTRVAKRGRKRGLGLCGMSQRPADVKKDFITQCDWLTWHRLTWENDTQVVRRVVDKERADAVQDLGDGEAFLMADFLSEDVQRVQVRRKRTFDAGATPDLDDYERPELKSVSGDLVGELEEISEQEERRQNRIAELERRVEELQDEKAALEEELENARDMREMASQFAEAMQTSGGNGDVASEKVDELIDERNALQRRLEERDDRIGELEGQVAELQQELDQRPDVSERAVEAVDVLAEEFGAGSDDESKWKQKYQTMRDRVEELEKRQPSGDNLDSDPLENRKVQSVVRDVESRLNELGEKERQMLRYYLVSGPASMEDAYKYAGGSPTSGAKSSKTRELRDAGLVKKVGRGEYAFGLRDYLGDVLSGFSEGEIDCVHDHLEETVYETVMEEATA